MRAFTHYIIHLQQNELEDPERNSIADLSQKQIQSPQQQCAILSFFFFKKKKTLNGYNFQRS